MMRAGNVPRRPWQQLCVLITVVLSLSASIQLADAQGFCSAFGNRSPRPQPGLQNCTWYRESSCCLNEEVTSLFNTVNPPDNADGRCLNFLNYLMCYVCDPGQSNFYQQERLTVCHTFCDDVLAACSNAVLKGVHLGTHFVTNGTAFCKHLRFEVGTNVETCFTLAPSRRTLRPSSSTAPRPGRALVLALGLLAVATCRARCLPALLVAAAVLLTALCVVPQPSVALVTNANIQGMAAAVESALVNIAGDGIKRDRVQDAFEMASSSRNMLNASSILATIERQLQDLVGDLNSAAADLARDMLAARVAYKSSSQTPEPLADLPLAKYIDSDNISALSTLNMSYNSTYRRFISQAQSVVKIADEVPRTGADLLETVQWSAGIDPSLARLQRRRNVRWTYFGSETGVYRSYPAAEWPSTFAGLKGDYDPRSRPWYLAATSGPKAVGIFLDCSTSMEDNGRWNMAVAAVRQIVNSLTRDDEVNIMCARGSYYNSGGVFRTYTREVLGCSRISLTRATVSNRAQLLERLSEQSPAGSAAAHESALQELVAMFSDTPRSCMNVLIFITDGLDTDDNHFRDRCRSNDNNGGGGYHGCNIIRLSNQAMWNIVTAVHVTRSLRVVSIETGNQGSQLPGMMACDNDGVFIQLQSSQNVRFQLSPYFSYLSRLGNPSTDSIRPTAPYIDVSGLGRIITLSRAIYEPGNASILLGVVGVDAVLDDLENTLLDDQFGLSYAFLIDTEGRAIVHPRLTPSAALVGDPIYPRVTELEQDPTGAPSQFNDVLVRMMRQESGVSAVITGPRPQQRGSVSDGVVFREGISFTYHYTAVSATQYSFAFVLTVEDTDQDTLQEIPFRQSQPVNYYHELQMYSSAERAAQGIVLGTNLGYGSDNNPLFITRRQSTFKLASRAFCDPTRYLLSDFPSFDSVVSFFNSNQSYVPCTAGGRYLEGIRPTVWATQSIQDVWMNNRSLATQDEVAWTYFGSANGMWRSFPGSQSTRSYDPTRRPWYHRALANLPSLYATSAIYLDAGGVGKVVTVAQTIFHARNTTSAVAAVCTVAGSYDGGCACTSHTDCRSQYCDRGSCTNPAIAGVAAIDIRYSRFASLMETTFNSVLGVAAVDRCTDDANRCILVNDAAEIVYDESIIARNISDRDPRNFANVPLAFLHGGVMLSLLDEGVFTRFSFVNRQGSCQIAPYTPSESDRDIILSADQQDNYFENRGPIPRFQNNFGCELDQILYQRNPSMPLSDFSRSFQGPCEDGSYRIYPVGNTNLLLIVIERTQVKSDFLFNFNCHIFNNVARSGGFRSEETACGSGSDGTEVSATCSPFSGYVPQCSFNSAPSISQSLAVLIACLLPALYIIFT